MDYTREVISAFLDGEAFDPDELITALSDHAGRELLVDLAALRRIVQPQASDAGGVKVGLTGDSRRLRSRWPLHWSAAAALVVALIGGYALGARRGSAAIDVQAPPATRIVHATTLDEAPAGGVR